MRRYSEPTMKNLLRMPLVMGVPFTGLLALAFVVLSLMILTSGSKSGNSITLVIGLFGYFALRVCTKFLTPGWEDEFLYPLEKRLRKRAAKITLTDSVGLPDLSPADTLEESDLISTKETLKDALLSIQENQNLLVEVNTSERGSTLAIGNGKSTEATQFDHCYTLAHLPVSTNPLSISQLLTRVKKPHRVFVRLTGIGFTESKRKVENSRKRNSRAGQGLLNIDSEVTFEESSKVLEAMSRGDETLFEFSMTVFSSEPLSELDVQYFKKERNKELALSAIRGERKKHFRVHLVRSVTASDLVPSFLDPQEQSTPILKSIRGNPLYFSPCDSRLEALHWLVVGASGTGKSFFVGAVLKRLVDQGTPMSVLFVDHNRSFRRATHQSGGKYLEPQSITDLHSELDEVFGQLDAIGSIAGIELSDLSLEDKKEAARMLLSQLESFLRRRGSLHPIYVVLDECWNFIRDEPVLVQRAFREFRKLNGAVIAITQSLSDFLSDHTGKSIVQNTPVRILLRQGEDVGAYRGVLGLNDVEISRLRYLKQQKPKFSECIIKTSFLSRLGRLYPTQEEHELFRTDNIREEMIARARPYNLEGECVQSYW